MRNTDLHEGEGQVPQGSRYKQTNMLRHLNVMGLLF